MQLPLTQVFEVRHPSDVGAARRAAQNVAESLGFESKATEEIALAMTELATNLLKHARQGQLILRPLESGQKVGLQIESQDQGPGIPSIERAMTDGFSTGASLGTGLGAVNRLLDEFDIVSQPGSGTHMLGRKWRREAAPHPRTCPLAFGVASRPYPGCEQNGDAFVLRHEGERTLVGVIDGLGHGESAHRAAEAAREFVESHALSPLAQIFTGVGRVCRATRGVVMALVRFDWGRQKVLFASIGDIETRVFPYSERFSLALQRGILGLNAPPAVVTEHAWAPTNVMVLHSDGLHTHWSWDDFPGLLGQPAPLMARRLLLALARDKDDATVMVIRDTQP